VTASSDDASLAPLLKLASQWLVGIALVAVTTLLFLSVNAVQLTSAGVGQRLLARYVAVATDIDVRLAALEEGVREEAESGGDPVRVPDFPIAVDLSREEALELQGGALRARILDESAARLYEDGTSVWAGADPEGARRIDTVSEAGAVDRGLGLISEDVHTVAIVVTGVLGFLAFVLGVALVVSVRTWPRLLSLSGVVVAAALPSLAGAVALRFVFRAAQEGADPFVYGLLDVGVEAMWVPLRNYLALTALGVVSFLVTVGLMWASYRWARAEERPRAEPPPLA
jgi:hypothetical protein